MEKDHLLSIGQLAKMRGITTETLRHYDRIGLLKPHYVDPNNGQRYYSTRDTEKLLIILELQQLDMSLAEIKEYLHARSPERAWHLLDYKEEELRKQIEKSKKLKSELSHRKDQLQKQMDHAKDEGFYMKEIKERFLLITVDSPIENEEEEWMVACNLAKVIGNTFPLPTFASQNYVGLIKKVELENHKYKPYLCFQIGKPENFPKNNVIRVPANTYLCYSYTGPFLKLGKNIEEIKTYMDKHKLNLTGPVLKVTQLDVSIVKNQEYSSYEVQIPVH